MRAVQAGLDGAGAIGRFVPEGERDGRTPQLSGQACPVRIVDVDHRDRGLEIGEEQALGPVVLLHRLVEIQMVLREVGEHRRGEVDGVGAMQR